MSAHYRRQLREDDARAQELLNTDLPPRPTTWDRFRQAAVMEQHVTHGQPPFPHTLNIVLSVLTGGLWLPVYWLMWLGSARRRYQRQRRGLLRREGLL